MRSFKPAATALAAKLAHRSRFGFGLSQPRTYSPVLTLPDVATPKNYKP